MRNSLLIAKLVTLVLMTISSFAYATPEEKAIVGQIDDLGKESSKCVNIVREGKPIATTDVIPGMALRTKDQVTVTCDSSSITVREGGNKPLTITKTANNPHTIEGKSLSTDEINIFTAAWNVLKRAGYLVVTVVTTDTKAGCSDDSKVRWEGENSQQTIAAGQRSLYIGLNRECYPQPPSGVELCPSEGKCQSITTLPTVADWKQDNQLLGNVVINANFEGSKSYTVKMSWNKTTSTVVTFKTTAGGDNQLSSLEADVNSSLPIFEALDSWNNDSDHALEAYQKVAIRTGHLAKVAKTVISMKKPPKIQH